MSVWKRITGFHFPAWVPVATIIAVVFGILGALFYIRSTAAAPRIGDHNHAAYAIYIGSKRQPNIPTFTGPEETHTHGDGIIHMHPFIPAGEGAGSAIGKFFEYGGGRLTGSQLKVPGQRETYNNGDTVEGRPGKVRVLRADSGIHPLGSGFERAIQACDAKDESAFEEVNSRYIPKDGDCMRIIFAAPEVPVKVEPDHTVIDQSSATREVTVEVTGTGAETVFSPATIEVEADETVKVVLINKSVVEDPTKPPFHGLRFSGADGQYGTSDDYVTDPPTLDPGQEGVAIIRYKTAGEFEFRDEGATEGVSPVIGKVIVGEPEATPPPDATPTPVPADLTLDVTASDTAFEPSTLTVEVGKTFRINLANTGTFVKNLRIAGPDGVFQTEDDIVTGSVTGGGTGEVSGKIDTPGQYPFRDDFHQTILTGTLTVQ